MTVKAAAFAPISAGSARDLFLPFRRLLLLANRNARDTVVVLPLLTPKAVAASVVTARLSSVSLLLLRASLSGAVLLRLSAATLPPR